jgi:hypothetical protein
MLIGDVRAEIALAKHVLHERTLLRRLESVVGPERLESLQHLWVDIVFRATVLTEDHRGPIRVLVSRPVRQTFVIWVAVSSKGQPGVLHLVDELDRRVDALEDARISYLPPSRVVKYKIHLDAVICA